VKSRHLKTTDPLRHLVASCSDHPYGFAYVDLTGANLYIAILYNAKLTGAKWFDGRICAANSIGTCK